MLPSHIHRLAIQRTLVLLTAVLLSVPGCGPDLRASFFEIRKDTRLGSTCKGVSPSTVGFYSPTEVFASANYGASQVAAVTRGVASFYAPYGITFEADSLLQKVSFEYLIDTTMEEIEQTLIREGYIVVETLQDGVKSSYPKGTDAYELRVGELLFRNVREFVKTRRDAGARGIQIAMIRGVAKPSLQIQGADRMAGIGFSKKLFERVDSNLLLTKSLVGDVEDSLPTLFIFEEPLFRFLDDKGRTTVLAHEIGHSLGLPHVDDEDNLMFHMIDPKADCLQYLTEDQLAILAGQEVSGGVARDAGCDSGPSHLEELTRQAVDQVMSALEANHANQPMSP